GWVLLVPTLGVGTHVRDAPRPGSAPGRGRRRHGTRSVLAGRSHAERGNEKPAARPFSRDDAVAHSRFDPSSPTVKPVPVVCKVLLDFRRAGANVRGVPG